MQNLIPQILQWAEERNIINGSGLERETLNLVSTSGRLTNFINERDICGHGIGDAIIQMIILCRMRGMSVHESLKFTKKITDDRIADPHVALIMVMKYLGELSGDVYKKSDLRTNMGYLLIHIIAFCNSLDFPVKDCTVLAFQAIKDDTYIMFNGMRINETDENFLPAKKIIEAARKESSRKLRE